MAKLERTLNGDFVRIRNAIEQGVMNGSITASLEDRADWQTATARCSVMVFERYSHMGGNRVSMNVTLFQSAGVIRLCAITAGGSQAMFWKMNTIGEEAFLDTLLDVLNSL